MRKLLLLLLPALLGATTILSYNIYDRTDRVDLMLTFDTPFEGSLRQSRQQDKIIIKLDDTSIDMPKVKNITSPFISKLTIAPIGSEVQIIAKVPPSVGMQASKTSDAYGLRLRFSKKAAAAAPAAANEPDLSTLPTKPEGEMTQSYYVVIAILLIGIVTLLVIKRRMSNGGGVPAAPAKPWLFKGKSARQEKEDGVQIRFQKSIDQANRVVMLDYGEESYLVVVGNSNLLLDKFNGAKPVSQSEFDTMLQSKHEELDTFLQLEKENETLQNYKEKASGLDLDDLIDRRV